MVKNTIFSTVDDNLVAMQLLTRIFGSQSKPNKVQHSFGRYSDNYKEQEKYAHWDEALLHFENKDYLKSVESFLEYIKDDGQQNLEYTIGEDSINFTFYQGSKKITGVADNQSIKAEAKIAKTSSLDIGFLRRLIELNFDLKYSRYALDGDHNVVVVFHSYILDTSPYKMYYGLKELALNADRQDDILVSDFVQLDPINMGHIKDISSDIKEIKASFLLSEIDNALQLIDQTTLNMEKYPGALSYVLLSLVYKLDFLIRPEGKTMEAIDNIHKQYFDDSSQNAHVKNQEMIRVLRKLTSKKPSDFYEELYRVKSTFGVASATSHSRLVDFINGELKNMDWYVSSRYFDIAMHIPGYIIGYCLFSYALPVFDRELLLLYYQIMNPDFFKKLSYNFKYRNGAKLNSKSIKTAIKNIFKSHSDSYDFSEIDYSILDVRSDLKFAKSYLTLIANVRVSPKNN